MEISSLFLYKLGWNQDEYRVYGKYIWQITNYLIKKLEIGIWFPIILDSKLLMYRAYAIKFVNS